MLVPVIILLIFFFGVQDAYGFEEVLAVRVPFSAYHEKGVLGDGNRRRNGFRKVQRFFVLLPLVFHKRLPKTCHGKQSQRFPKDERLHPVFTQCLALSKALPCA